MSKKICCPSCDTIGIYIQGVENYPKSQIDEDKEENYIWRNPETEEYECTYCCLK